MKQISYWAKKHVWQTRALIVVIYILLNILGIFTGKLLNDLNIIITQPYFIACIIFTIILWIWYPEKRDTKTNITRSILYYRRKLFDFSLGFITFLMIIYAGNTWQNLFIQSESALASKITPMPKDSAIYNNPLIKSFITSLKEMDITKLNQKEKLRLIKKQIQTIKKDSDTSKSDKTLLIILSVIAALALLYILAFLSCSIACAGSEALAIVVALGGTALIIYLLVRMIKRISNRPPKKENTKTEEK